MKKPLTLLTVLLLAPLAALSATITVQTDQRLGRIEPLLYGQFIEHLGRCINGGIFEPGSPLADTNGFRRDVLEKVRELNPPARSRGGGTPPRSCETKSSPGLRPPVVRHLSLG